MHILCDIDNTIAKNSMPVLLKLLNERMNLHLPDALLSTMSAQDFLSHPEVCSYKQRVGEDWFDLAIRWATLDPENLIAMQPISKAIDGLQKLARFGSIHYCTSRKIADHPARSRQLEEATCTWLITHEFPEASQVFFCSSLSEKFFQAATLIEQTASPVLLIDDLYHKLLEEAQHLDTKTSTLLSRNFTLCAFRAKELPLLQQVGFRVIPLLHWSKVEHFIHLLTQKGVPYESFEESLEPG